MPEVRFGFTLPNRGLLFGLLDVDRLLALAERADRAEVFDSLWVGDSLVQKPRLEAVALLGALAARTSRVRIGPACMASFPMRNAIVFAYEMASIDILSKGRLVLVVCTGIYPPGQQDIEMPLVGRTPRDRVGLMEEGIEVIRLLWSQESASYAGKYYQFENLRLEPRPVQRPGPPIWIASNPQAGSPERFIERSVRRTARLADGWMTSIATAAQFGEMWRRTQAALVDLGKDPNGMDNMLYYNININTDRDAAFAESKRFLDTYYSTNWPAEIVEAWTAYGSVDDCVAKLRAYIEAGCKQITLRMTAWDQEGQLERTIHEVIPALS